MIRDIIAWFESEDENKGQDIVDALTNGIKELLAFIMGKIEEALA